MRTLTYLAAVTADGFIAAQNGSPDTFLNDLGYFRAPDYGSYRTLGELEPCEEIQA